MTALATRDPVMVVSGTLGVLGNVLGVVFLGDISGAYRLARLDEWHEGVLLHPSAAAASAVAFTIGLFALALWAVQLATHAQSGVARAGAWLVAAGSLANGIGTATPLVLALHVGDQGPAGASVARALLGLTLTLDATFNLALGVGLLMVGLSWHCLAPNWLRWLALAAGLTSIPVAAQAVYDPAANLLFISGPLWLTFALVTGLRRWVAA